MSGFFVCVIIFLWDEIMLSLVFFRRVLLLIICIFLIGFYFLGFILFIYLKKIKVYKKKKLCIDCYYVVYFVIMFI